MTRHYVKNTDLVEELRISHKNNRATEALSLQLLLIVTNYAKKGSFNGYSYIDEMRGEAIVLLLESWQKFDIDFCSTYPYYKGTGVDRTDYTEEDYVKLNDIRDIKKRYANPISYFTQLVHNSFLGFMKKEKKIAQRVLDAQLMHATPAEIRQHFYYHGDK